GVLERSHRLEVGELLGDRVESNDAIRRRSPDLALAVDIEGNRAAEWRHGLRRLVNADLLGLHVELAEAAAAGIDVEPQIAIAVAGEAVCRGGELAVLALDLEVLHFPGLAVDLADGHPRIRVVDGVIEIAVETHGPVMGKLAELGRGAQ